MTYRQRASRAHDCDSSPAIAAPKLALSPDEDPPRPARELLPAIAENLRRLRLERGLSLEALSHGSGVSESLLYAIEQRDETPTIRLLWSIATALGVPFGRLVQQTPATRGPVAVERLVRRPVLAEGGAGARRTELFELTLPPGGREPPARGQPDTQESLLVTAGKLLVRADGREHLLCAGDSLALPGDAARAYENRGDTLAVAYLKITPRSPD